MDTATITAAALQVLDEVGLDKLSMRLLAARLGVHAGGLYYYLPDKSALLRAMSNEVCRFALADFATSSVPDDPPTAQAARMCDSVRTALHSHRDAARVLCSGPLNGSSQALALMDRLIELLEQDLDPQHGRLAADTLMSYISGFVLQEQAEPPSDYPYEEPLDTLRSRYPRVFLAADDSEDDMFTAAVQAIIDGFVVRYRAQPVNGRAT